MAKKSGTVWTGVFRSVCVVQKSLPKRGSARLIPNISSVSLVFRFDRPGQQLALLLTRQATKTCTKQLLRII